MKLSLPRSILSEAERSRRIQLRERMVVPRGSSTSLGMTERECAT
jgi:hypothetical protein